MSFTGAGRSATAKATHGLGRGAHSHSRDTVDNTIDGTFATDVAYAAADAAIIAGTSTLANTVQVCPASSSNAAALNAALGHVVTFQLVEDTTVTISNLTAGQALTFVATQHASSAKTLAFASTFFAGGTEPTLSTGASAVDIYTIINIGGQLYGFVAGQDMKT